MTAPLPYHIIPKERIGNVIDAIYAFSMTLLVTTISVPPKYDQVNVTEPVQAILTSVLPDLLHYFIAFIILAIFWYFEHQRFRHLIHLDRPLLCMNITSLAFVCLIPFTTNVAGDYPFDTFGAMLFEANIFIIGIIAFAQWRYIGTRRADLVPDLDSVWIEREVSWTLVFPLLAIIGIIIAVFQIYSSAEIFLLAPFIMAYLFWNDPVKTNKPDS
ncbi:TMEM175 family protein [Methanoregula sp.]|uniref:TMEM175 family protein n=1 Tax=Methanoregula sp. TaxID=2052170 RepID=UPI00236F7294|nr:TMEM175 family protein [Methanoregula sp.]MDD1686426.1 DUF1211 domain-containing protein [Methanoregula sp.]